MNSEKKSLSQDEIQPILKEIGQRLRQKRKEKNQNYVSFAEEHGFPNMTVSRIENGENSNLKTIISFAHTVDITLEDLFAGL